MAESTKLVVGSEPWTLTVPAEHAVALQRAEFAAPAASAAELVRAALEKPFHFEPMRRALTPEGVAKPGWLALATRFADRFLIGSDNFYDAPGVSLRDLPRAADVLNFVRQLPAATQAKIATENPRRL